MQQEKQIKVTTEILNVLTKYEVTKIDSIALFEVLKYNLLVGNI